MIKYEILKQNDNLIIFEKNDDFFKMLIDDLFNKYNNTNNIHECFQLSCEIQTYYDSFETMRNILKMNDIIDYVIAFDVEHEKIYIYDKKRYNVFYIDYDNLICDNFSICSLNNVDKTNVLQIILNCMLYN